MSSNSTICRVAVLLCVVLDLLLTSPADAQCRDVKVFCFSDRKDYISEYCTPTVSFISIITYCIVSYHIFVVVFQISTLLAQPGMHPM